MAPPPAADAPSRASRTRPQHSAYPTGRTTQSFYRSKSEFIKDSAHGDDAEIVPLGFMLDSLKTGLPKNLLADTRTGVFYSIGLYYLNLGRVARENDNVLRRVFGPAYFPSRRSRALNDDRLVHRGAIYSLCDDVLGITFGEPIFTSQLLVEFVAPVLENTTYLVEGVGEVIGRSKTGSLKVRKKGYIRDGLTGDVLVRAEGLFIQTAAMGKMYQRMLAAARKKGASRTADTTPDAERDDDHSQEEYRRALARRLHRERLMAPLRVKDDEDAFLFDVPFYKAAEDGWAASDPFVRELTADRRESGLHGCKARRKRGAVVDPVDGKAFLRVFADERSVCAPCLFLITSEGHANIAHGGCIGSVCVEACRRAYGGFAGRSSAASKYRWRIDSLYLRYRGQVPLNKTLRLTLESVSSDDQEKEGRVVRTYRGALDSGDGATSEEDVVLYTEFAIVLSADLADIQARLTTNKL